MSKPRDEDVELMLRVRDGDRDAFETLVHRYQTTAHATAYRLLGDATQAQDIAQDAFLRLYRSRERYRPTAAFRTFFYRILVNLCYSAMRKARPTYSLDSPSRSGEHSLLDQVVDDQGVAPEDATEKRELRAAVRAAIESLPPNQRLALVLARFQGLSYAEVASAMKTSSKAVKSLLARARAALKARLSDYA